MIDHIEGWLRMDRAVRELHEATLKKDYARARELCAELASDARLVAHQISIEEEQHAALQTPPR